MISNPNEKKKITLKHFKHRRRKRPKHEHEKQILEIEEVKFRARIEEGRKNKTPAFTLSELEKVLKGLTSGKSKDFNGYICELFKVGVIGGDLKLSLLMMVNQMNVNLSFLSV